VVLAKLLGPDNRLRYEGKFDLRNVGDDAEPSLWLVIAIDRESRH
jgi:hypothetical protein